MPTFRQGTGQQGKPILTVYDLVIIGFFCLGRIDQGLKILYKDNGEDKGAN